MKKFKIKKYLNAQRPMLNAKCGFTLIEMLVTISVFTIVTSVMLANYPKFSDNLSLERTTQEIALSLREAKTYSLAVREFGIGSDIFPGYGVHFDLSSGPSKNYLLFADLDEGKDYDSSGSEKQDEFVIQTNVSIKEFCKILDPLGDCGSYEKLEVVYFRPDPNVTITGITPLGVRESLPFAAIVVEASQGGCKSIIVRTTGQVSIERCD